MSKTKKVLLLINDFTGLSDERFFICSGVDVTECSAESVVAEADEIICHDYWLIAPALYKKTKSLPKCITDVDELRIATSGRREDRENRDKTDISVALVDFLDIETIVRYRNIVFKNASFELEVFKRVGEALVSLYTHVEKKAKEANEWERHCQIERPVGDYLIRAALDGIAINTDALRRHKAKIDFSYYMALKEFSAKYSLPLHVPSDEEVIEYLTSKDLDFSGVGVNYVLNFVPLNDGFSEKLIELRKISNARGVLKAIPVSQKRITPIVDIFGSITSRIYYKDPSLQSLSKLHRDIISADDDKKISYVDFGQYEAGIMGALSGDVAMLTLFSSGDLYAQAAEHIFSDVLRRKEAKRLFLSYAYGMKRNSLIDAAVGFGALRATAKSFFSQFVDFERWKLEVHKKFQSSGKIGTSLGNYMTREGTEELSDKERRSAISQVVQGTASLIFKKALLKLSLMDDVELKVPMHDAVLFQHANTFDPSIVAELFSQVMTDHFGGLITGKAYVDDFMK